MGRDLARRWIKYEHVFHFVEDIVGFYKRNAATMTAERKVCAEVKLNASACDDARREMKVDTKRSEICSQNLGGDAVGVASPEVGALGVESIVESTKRSKVDRRGSASVPGQRSIIAGTSSSSSVDDEVGLRRASVWNLVELTGNWSRVGCRLGRSRTGRRSSGSRWRLRLGRNSPLSTRERSNYGVITGTPVEGAHEAVGNIRGIAWSRANAKVVVSDPSGIVHTSSPVPLAVIGCAGVCYTLSESGLKTIAVGAIVDHLANGGIRAGADRFTARIAGPLALSALHQARVGVAPVSGGCPDTALGLLHHDGENELLCRVKNCRRLKL